MSAINLPIYLPPEPYSLETVITTCLSNWLSVLVSSTKAWLFSLPCFKCFTSNINKIPAITNANPSATGPAYKTPIIPKAFPNTTKAGIKNKICLDSDNNALLILFPTA